MAVSLNGKGILRANITEPRIAAWTAMVEVDSESPISGRVALDIDGESFSGTVVQSDVDHSRWKGLVVGGGGGLHKILGARYYVEPTVGMVLADICREAGEALDPSISPAITARALPRWSRLQGEAHTQLRQVADELELDWRMTRLGLVWLGQETWLPVVADTLDQHYEPDLRLVVVVYKGQSDRPVVRPGVSLDGRNVERTVTEVSPDGLSQQVYFDETKGPTGLLAVALQKAKEYLLPKLLLSRTYGVKMISSSGNEATLLADDVDIAGKWKGLDRVAMVFGLPGVSVMLAPGARGRLWWDAGRPSRPRTGQWDAQAPVQQITITLTGIGAKLRIEGDVEVTGEVTAKADTAAVKLSTHVHPSATGPTGVPTPEP